MLKSVQTTIFFGLIVNFLAFTNTHRQAEAITRQQKGKQILDRLFEDYEKDVRPSGANETGPVDVAVNMFVRSISKFDDINMEYRIQLTFRVHWLDERLKFDSLNTETKFPFLVPSPDQIWNPDLFFSNELEGYKHNVLKPNMYVRVFPNGEIIYNSRISLTLSCPMNFKLFPFDIQTCSIRMASYGFTNDDIKIKWKTQDPVMVTSDMYLPKFTFEKFTTDYCDSQTNTGVYSCLRVDFQFKREFYYYLMQIYIPSIMLVFLSWVVFWLDRTAVSARIFLGVATLLTMAVQVSRFNESLANVSYIKAIDVWTGICLTFVFFSILETATANFVYREYDDKKKQKRDWAEEQNEPLTPKPKWCTRELFEQMPWSEIIDVISRFLFPLLFIIFNLVYWCPYLGRSDYSMDNE